MNRQGPLALAAWVASVLDELRVPHVLGGSMASSLVGEPRTTVDVDIAAKVDRGVGGALVEKLSEQLYVPVDSALLAIADRTSFNALDLTTGLKVDIFVLGDGVLDRRQIERRRLMTVLIGSDDLEIWVTSPEDQVLRKLDWHRQSGGMSDRQWRDVVNVLRVQGDALDLGYLRSTAVEVGLEDSLAAALAESG